MFYSGKASTRLLFVMVSSVFRFIIDIIVLVGIFSRIGGSVWDCSAFGEKLEGLGLLLQ